MSCLELAWREAPLHDLLRFPLVCFFVLACAGGGAAEGLGDKESLAQRHDFFERKVRPLLKNRCQKCHGTVRQRGALRLDTSEGLFFGSTNGPVVVAGDLDASVLVQLVRSTEERRMPPPRLPDDYLDKELKALYDNPPLEAHEIEIFERWVGEGAVWPGHTEEAVPARSESDFDDADRAFWSFQPVRDSVLPAVKNEGWPGKKVSLDHFILARLEAAGLEPSPRADRLTILRRVTFDLTGLPPTSEEIRSFLADESEDAYRRLVDRLLESPHYGERWGRHWLDVARFAETAGHDGNNGYLFAWRYRDWVIDAFNQDKPFDEFLVEQLAGDLLPATEDTDVRLARQVATGFLQVGPKPVGMRDKRQLLLEIADEQIHTTGVAFMGLSLGCARCHDHKFDPIPTIDYYSLAGIFLSTQSLFDHERDSMHLELSIEGSDGPVKVMAVRDKPRPRNVRVHTRGSYHTLAEEAPRRFLQIIAGDNHEAIETRGSGRLEFARWIASPEHPLTARVAVNRVWQKHFGVGLVSTVDDFGARGDPPSHPELLDWLARRFVEDSWSVKSLHRRILLSSTYRQSHREDAHASSVDPGNVLLWRMPRRRLSAEEIRDTLLALGGILDLDVGGSLFTAGYAPLQSPRDITVVEVADLERFRPYGVPRRSVYLPVIRNQMHPALALFDASNAHEASGQRTTTTIAPQSLFFLNSGFVKSQARGLAVRLLALEGVSDEERVRFAYEEAFCRAASEEETRAALQFIDDELDFADPDRRQRKSEKAEAGDLPPYADLVRETPGLIALYDFDEFDFKNETRLFRNEAVPGVGDARAFGDIALAAGVTSPVEGSGAASRSVVLDGKGQRLELSAASHFDFSSGEISVEYWVYPESVKTATVVGRDGGNQRLWKSGLAVREIGGVARNVVFHEFFSAPLRGYRESFEGGVAPVGLWTHVVFTCGQGKRKLFVNGVQVDDADVAKATIPVGDVPVSVGSRSGEGEYFHGRIDDVSIYDRVLEVPEVAARYSSATGKKLDPLAALRNAAWTSLCHALLCMNEFIYVE